MTGLTSLARAGEWTPDPSLGSPEQHKKLYDIGRQYLDPNFDPDANLIGTPSKHPPNKKSHAVRESAYYAYGLLITGDPADKARAQAVLREVLKRQDTDPQTPMYGAFDWYAEDKEPQDANSAAFVGAALAQIADLDNHTHVLDADLRKQVDDAGRLAIAAILRRDVDAGYTNIAVLSCSVAAAGAKIWTLPKAGEWADAKLAAVLKLTDDGEVEEYLSPTYYAVTLGGAYGCKQYAFSDDFAAKADALIDHMWKQIALAYHAPTYQLGGPFLRAYGDNMLEYAAGVKYFLYLALDGNYPLPAGDTEHGWDQGGLVCMASMPVKPRPEFKQSPPDWRQWTAVGSGTTPVRQLRQFRDGNFILGTVAFQDEWKQKRNLVAYWRNDQPEGKFQIGYCIDESNETLPGGFPGEKLHFYSDQKKNAALVAITAGSDIPGYGGTMTLVFAPTATAESAKPGEPLKVVDGSIATYLYPVSNGATSFTGKLDGKTFRASRLWTDSDSVGAFRVLAYVAVFKPADQPPPQVSDLTLKGDTNGVSASAKVDGVELAIPAKN